MSCQFSGKQTQSDCKLTYIVNNSQSVAQIITSIRFYFRQGQQLIYIFSLVLDVQTIIFYILFFFGTNHIPTFLYFFYISTLLNSIPSLHSLFLPTRPMKHRKIRVTQSGLCNLGLPKLSTDPSVTFHDHSLSAIKSSSQTVFKTVWSPKPSSNQQANSSFPAVFNTTCTLDRMVSNHFKFEENGKVKYENKTFDPKIVKIKHAIQKKYALRHHLAKQFAKLDTNHKGVLTSAEIKKLMASVGYLCNQQESQELAQYLSSKMNGSLDLDTFLKVIEEPKPLQYFKDKDLECGSKKKLAEQSYVQQMSSADDLKKKFRAEMFEKFNIRTVEERDTASQNLGNSNLMQKLIALHNNSQAKLHLALRQRFQDESGKLDYKQVARYFNKMVPSVTITQAYKVAQHLRMASADLSQEYNSPANYQTLTQSRNIDESSSTNYKSDFAELKQQLDHNLFRSSANSLSLFRKFDKDQDGFVSAQDFQRSIAQLKTSLKEEGLVSQERARSFFREVVGRGKQEVNFKQFSQHIKAGMGTENASEPTSKCLPHIRSQSELKSQAFRQIQNETILKQLSPKNAENKRKTRFNATPQYKNTYLYHDNAPGIIPGDLNFKVQYQKEEKERKRAIELAKFRKIREFKENERQTILRRDAQNQRRQQLSQDSHASQSFVYQYICHINNQWK